MGKAAKTRRSEQRKSAKRAAKSQQQAKYDAFVKSGSNKKKKGGGAGNGSISTTKHLVACGNHGCERQSCNPGLARPRMNDSNDPRVRFRTISDMKKVVAWSPYGRHDGATTLTPSDVELFRQPADDGPHHFDPATGLPQGE